MKHQKNIDNLIGVNRELTKQTWQLKNKLETIENENKSLKTEKYSKNDRKLQRQKAKQLPLRELHRILWNSETYQKR